MNTVFYNVKGIRNLIIDEPNPKNYEAKKLVTDELKNQEAFKSKPVLQHPKHSFTGEFSCRVFVCFYRKFQKTSSMKTWS